jgi:hypothetical protein
LAAPQFSHGQPTADTSSVLSPGPALQTGVSSALAAFRSRTLYGITYDLQFDISAPITDPVPAKEKLGQQQILDEQLQCIQNEDRKERWQFLPKLKAMILQAADNLFRAERLVQ